MCKSLGVMFTRYPTKFFPKRTQLLINVDEYTYGYNTATFLENYTRIKLTEKALEGSDSNDLKRYLLVKNLVGEGLPKHLAEKIMFVTTNMLEMDYDSTVYKFYIAVLPDTGMEEILIKGTYDVCAGKVNAAVNGNVFIDPLHINRSVVGGFPPSCIRIPATEPMLFAEFNIECDEQ